MDLLTVAKSFCLTAVGGAAISSGYFFFESAKSAEKLPVILDSQLTSARKDAVSAAGKFGDGLNTEIDKTRVSAVSTLNSQADLTREQLLGEVQRLDVDVNGTVASLGIQALNRVDRINTTLDIQLAQANQTLDKRSSEVTMPLGKVIGDVSQSSDLFFDCEYNEDCLFNRFQGISKALEMQSQTVSKELPGFAESVRETSTNIAGISKDVKIVTDKIVAPKPWYDKAWEFISTGATLSATFGRVGVLK